jgi:HAE1 family hydrophobic/amphiphilic exporter-1
MGDTDSTQISISVQMPEGSLFEDTAAMSDTIIERIDTIEDVDTVGAIMGSGLSLMGSYGSTDTENISMYVILKDDKKHTSQEISAQIADMTADLDCEVSVSASSMDMSSLGGSGVSVMIKGSDLEQLMQISSDFADILASIEGTVEVSDGIDDPTPELKISIDKNKAMQHGLTVAQIYQELYTKLADPSTATTLTVDNKEYPVIVLDEADTDLTRDDIKNYVFTVTTQSGEEEEVKLSDIAEISDGEGLSSISRDGQQRYLTVSAEVDDDHNVTLVANAFEEKLAEYEMPEGYSYEMSGENETIMESMGQLIQLLAIGILIMYLIMVAQFQSLISPFIVLFTIPLAFTGGFLGLLLTGNIISIIAMIGFVMLCGIIVNNGIVFIDYTNQLREGGMGKREALIETGKTRLRPILMTALTTILAMSTMALGMGDGTDMVQPMAIVTIGGLIYGTLMTLFVVPCIYDLVRRDRKVVIEDGE